MLLGLGYVPGTFARSSIAQQFVAQNPVVTPTVGAAQTIAAFSPQAASGGLSPTQKKTFAPRSILPPATVDVLVSMPLWKKVAIAAAIAVPVGYLGYRVFKKKPAGGSASQ